MSFFFFLLEDYLVHFLPIQRWIFKYFSGLYLGLIFESNFGEHALRFEYALIWKTKDYEG